MDISSEMKKEVEVFGVTYDRYVLLQLQRILAETLRLQTIVEMPSHGAKAAGSLYSIGFGLVGCRVTLVNPEMDMLRSWRDLGMADRIDAVEKADVYDTGFKSGAFDLSWNFVTWTELDDPPAFLREMKRISNRYIMLVTCNNLQPGYPWHRLLHEWYSFPWTHGRNEYNYIHRVLRLFRRTGLKVWEYGAIDTPGWPDPSGPRDVRLHRRYGSAGHNVYRHKPYWEVPMIQYIKTGKFPGWMKALGKWDMAFRKGIFKLPMSHLFYVLGKK
jgi:hypothetical protein